MSVEPSDTSCTFKNFRKDFTKGILVEDKMSSDPITQFNGWLESAFMKNEFANAMTLSTVGTDLTPSSRIVLLRDISNGGFTFFTNYESQKAKDLERNAKASLLFFWPELERQIRIEGMVKVLPAKESDDYFESRPFESKVGAWVSKQSEVLKNREQLELNYQEALKKYADKQVPRPPHWGGYVLLPSKFEFWQGRENRLHDRIIYRQSGEQSWITERLMP